MPIPDNIDAARALALFYGIELPSNTNKGKKQTMSRLCEFLEIPPDKQKSLKEEFKLLLKSLRNFSKKGEILLESPERFSAVCDAFTTWIKSAIQALSPEAHAKVDRALGSPKLPPELLEKLIFPLLSRIAPRDEHMDAPLSFCRRLLTHHPRQFFRAVRLTEKHTGPEGEPAQSTLVANMQPLVRVLARLDRAEKARSKRPREAIEEALHAWSGAFEDSISRVCVFLWYVAQPIETADEALKIPQGAARRSQPGKRPELKKGEIFKCAHDWCTAHAIEFPFYPKLDKLRHSQAHEDYTLSTRTVELRGQDGIIDTLTIKQLLARVDQDIRFALHFPQCVNDAVSTHPWTPTDIDAAWEAAVIHLPALAHTTK